MTTKKYYNQKKEKVLAWNKNYYFRNKNKINKQKKKYYKKNRDKFLQCMKNYYNSHKLEIDAKNKIWRNNNQSNLRKSKKEYYNQNKEKLNENHKKYMKKRYKKDNKFNVLMRLRGRFGVAWRTFCKNNKIPQSKKYPIDYEKAFLHLSKTMPKDFEGWDIEHKIPLYKFNLVDGKDIKKAFSPENLQWMKHEDNLKKGKKILQK